MDAARDALPSGQTHRPTIPIPESIRTSSNGATVGNRKPTPWVVSIAFTDLPSDARVIREAAAVLERGARLTLLVPQSDSDASPPELTRAEIVWLPVRQQRGQTTLRGQLAFMRELVRWRNDQPRIPDVAHVHNMPDYLYWVVTPWQRAGTRVVMDIHDIMSDVALHRFRGVKGQLAAWTLARLERAVWRRADHIVTVHDEYRHRIMAAGPPSSDVTVVLNTPDPRAVRRELRRSPRTDQFKVVFHGSVTERSGILNAVRAMPAVVRAVPDARLYIVGTGTARQAVRGAIHELGLDSAVVFIDAYQPLSEAIDLISDASASVVPTERSAFTRYMLPVKLLEYAVLGIPSVATRLPLIHRYLGDDAVHFIDRPDPALIAEGLIRLALDPGYSERLATAAGRFSERHRWKRYADALSAALRLAP